MHTPPLVSTILVSALFLPALTAGDHDAARNSAEVVDKVEQRFAKALDALATSNESKGIVQALGTLREGFPESRMALSQAALSGPRRVRSFALRILGEKGDAAHELSVVTQALRAPHPEVRRAAVMAVRKLGSEGFAQLTHYLRWERDRNNLKMAIKTLQHWGEKEAIPHLVDLLGRTKEQSVQAFAYTALEVISGKKLGHERQVWEEYWDSEQLQEQAKQLVKEE